MRRGKDYRNALIRKIQVARREMPGLDDDVTYRAVLERVTGKDSLRAMNLTQLDQVIHEFHALGWGKPPRAKASRDTHGLPKNFPPKPDPKATALLMTKIEALLADKDGFVPWSYASAILKRMYRVERLEWATPTQLRGVITALSKGGKRKGGQTALGEDGRVYKRVWRGNQWKWEPQEDARA
ncbi:gp16 family protein [Desulfocurvus vexinensis]|uniref:gp16 family protein n=1 Tax=Desulfocurvus vexinensis TaxID=399548 RepID=UPI0004AF1299|nr:regulatory protein GemA [Desulfocurvus vexinensis]